jgi:polyhydroxyalkanoate synthesis regulator phasin
MKRLAVLSFLGMLLISFLNQPVWAGEVDILVRKLVEKGILTELEAKELLVDIRTEAAKEKAELEQAAQEAAKKEAERKMVKLPKWVEKMDLKGDLRLRYEHKDRDFTADRDRGRFRLRLGVETEPVDKVEVGFGLASGGDDPRSTNQSFSDTFSSKNIVIDYAYAKYEPLKWLSFSGGKIKNPIYAASDLLWDSDIRPEGAAAEFNWELNPNLELFFTPTFFILDEISGSSKDPYMYGLQPGFQWKIKDDIRFKLAGTYYGFDNVQGGTLEHSEDTNTLENGVLKFDYDSFALEGGIGFYDLGIVPHVAFFGQYIKNFDPDEENEGYLAGFRFGHRKLKNFGDWQFKYQYKRLERDAWPDVFPDSDFFGGATNAKGHEGIFKFGLTKNILLQADYYDSERIEGSPETSEKLLQLDLYMKF